MRQHTYMLTTCMLHIFTHTYIESFRRQRSNSRTYICIYISIHVCMCMYAYIYVCVCYMHIQKPIHAAGSRVQNHGSGTQNQKISMARLARMDVEDLETVTSMYGKTCPRTPHACAFKLVCMCVCVRNMKLVPLRMARFDLNCAHWHLFSDGNTISDASLSLSRARARSLSLSVSLSLCLSLSLSLSLFLFLSLSFSFSLSLSHSGKPMLGDDSRSQISKQSFAR
jgi:hypothetical protein